jgi:formate hydrogenlyase subunit 3/multisubunit Na+/H+ antiporter MnhD subunit
VALWLALQPGGCSLCVLAHSISASALFLSMKIINNERKESENENINK